MTKVKIIIGYPTLCLQCRDEYHEIDTISCRKQGEAGKNYCEACDTIFESQRLGTYEVSRRRPGVASVNGEMKTQLYSKLMTEAECVLRSLLAEADDAFRAELEFRRKGTRIAGAAVRS